MNAPRLAALLVGHAARLRAPAVTLALALVSTAALVACSGLPSHSKVSSHACADKFIQELATNQTVKGLWACFDSTMQQSLNAYGLSGDDAFVKTGGATPAGEVTTHYVGQQNGVVIYTAVIKSSDPTKPAQTLVAVVWVDPDGKIANFGVASPDL